MVYEVVFAGSYHSFEFIRIEIAKSLLSGSDLTIEDISNRLNFTDRNYFSFYFKQKTGVSPGRYKKQCAKP